MLSPQKEMTLIQCMRIYDEWRVSPDTVLKEKMEEGLKIKVEGKKFTK